MAYKAKDHLDSAGEFWVECSAKNKTGWVRDDLIHITEDDIHTCIPEDPDC